MLSDSKERPNSSPPTYTSGSRSRGRGSDRKKPPRLFFLLIIFVLIVACVKLAIYESHDDPRLRSEGGDVIHHLPTAGVVGKLSVDAVSVEAVSLGPALDEGQGLRRLRDLLVMADVNVTTDASKIPSWSNITSMYGPAPLVVGLDTCRSFRDAIPEERRMIGPAGIFNTGTNLLAELLHKNCEIVPSGKSHVGNFRDKSGMRWQVPWGKHTPASWRGKNVAYTDKQSGIHVPPEDVIPVVTIKDPYSWMGSMCRHSYAANWKHSKEHCPNLLPNDVDRKNGGLHRLGPDGAVTVDIRYNKENTTHHSSLAGMWNDYYGAYHNTKDYPRLLVRFEDLLLHPQYVISEVCSCAGGTMKGGPFRLQTSSAKGSNGLHTGSNGFLSALTRYGNPHRRSEGFDAADLGYAAENLRPELMEAYRYRAISSAVAPPKR